MKNIIKENENNNIINDNKTNYKYFIGIDVAKDKLDIFNTITGEYKTLKNNEESILKYVNDIDKNLKKETLIIIDLTGGYEKKVVNIFYKNDYSIITAEGLKVKNFSRTTKYNRAKTDKKDAEILVEYGKHFYNKLSLYTPKDDTREYITDIYNRILNYKLILQQEKNRIKQPNLSKVMKISILETIDFINNQIRTLKQEIKEVINKTKDKNDLLLIYNTLINQEGISEELGLFLLIKLKELGKVERKQLTSISGLAPIPYDSGTIKGHRYVRGGRKEIRSKMYFMAMNMLRFNKEYKNKMNNMVSKGKNKKVIIVALARKKLITLNAIIRDVLIKNQK